MKALVWSVCALLALLWSAALAAAGAVTALAALALEQAGSAGTAATLPAQMPPWLAPWVDPASWQWLREAAIAVVDGALSILPALGTLAGWLEPVLWAVWGLGLLLLLGLGAVLHSLAGDWQRQRATPAVAA